MLAGSQSKDELQSQRQMSLHIQRLGALGRQGNVSYVSKQELLQTMVMQWVRQARMLQLVMPSQLQLRPQNLARRWNAGREA